MGSKNLTCGAVTCSSLSCSSLTLGAPTFKGSTTVNQTSTTLPTSGAQIGFLYKGKLTGLQATTGWLIGTSAAAITNIAYLIPAIGVWQCVFEASATGFNTTQKNILWFIYQQHSYGFSLALSNKWWWKLQCTHHQNFHSHRSCYHYLPCHVC